MQSSLAPGHETLQEDEGWSATIRRGAWKCFEQLSCLHYRHISALSRIDDSAIELKNERQIKQITDEANKCKKGQSQYFS